MPESRIIEVSLPAHSTPKRAKTTAASTVVTEVNKDSKVGENPDSNEAVEENEAPIKQEGAEVVATPQDNQTTYWTVDGKQNIYNREKLYEEVWAKPVVDVAAQYGVSDVAILSLITLSDGNFGTENDGDDCHLSPT